MCKEGQTKTVALVELEEGCSSHLRPRRRQSSSKPRRLPVLQYQQPAIDLAWYVFIILIYMFIMKYRILSYCWWNQCGTEDENIENRIGNVFLFISPTVSRPRPISEVFGTSKSIFERAANDQTWIFKKIIFNSFAQPSKSFPSAQHQPDGKESSRQNFTTYSVRCTLSNKMKGHPMCVNGTKIWSANVVHATTCDNK